MLKKTILCSAICLAGGAGFSVAEETPDYDKWVAGFIQYYNADSNKPDPVGFLEDGGGIGAEFGIRMDKDWAIRFEFARHDITADTNKTVGTNNQWGNSYGIDFLRFLENDKAYLYGGVRQQTLDTSYRMVTVGVGKHWHLNPRTRLITEAGALHDIGQGFNDFSIKLGVAYTFGDTPGKAPVKKDMDSDNDGVMDSMDLCPNTPAGMGVDATGCNNDLDADGVINSLDKCPNTAKGTVVDAVGCKLAKDSDNDGVVDGKDKCPNTPMGDQVDNTGCTLFADNEITQTLQVLFGNNSAVVTNSADPKIAEFADFLKRYGNTSIVIEGHASAVGNADYNLEISELRAKSVVDVLVNEYGIDRSRLSAVGYGETQLLDDSNTAQAHSINRRIEAKVSAMVKEKLTK